jgi:formylglycine-generating enzyme
MFKRLFVYFKKRVLLILLTGFVTGLIFTILFNKLMDYTSTNESCEICHVHPHVFDSWKLSTHYDNPSGMHIGCVECHLPPKGQGYLKEKIITGTRDIYGYLFKDSADFNWEAKSTLEYAARHVYKESCIHCHENLFPLTLTKDGQDAHLYYTQNEDELRCINCHIDVGHYDPNITHAVNVEFGSTGAGEMTLYEAAVEVNEHKDFTETVPGTTISFNMKAIPGGSFEIGSPADAQMSDHDEYPAKTVRVSPFFMAEIEVTWDAYLAFYSATAAEGRTTDTEGTRTETDVDAITGPTPPYGQPDQNWGLGDRPAITMTHHGAVTFCRWLSQVTGKTYRLPTEAEWEYAARGGTQTPYFFEGQPKDFVEKGFIGGLFSKGSDLIDQYVIYEGNSQQKTETPEVVEPNPYGLINMLGNAAEFCSDWYAEDAYEQLEDGVLDPKGPVDGEERVIRGGYFRSPAGDVRCASRDYTKSVEWMKTDPQMPKSMWWFSDCNFVSFRVVCEFDEKTGKNN